MRSVIKLAICPNNTYGYDIVKPKMSVVVTPEIIEQLIARAELRGDWEDVEILKVLRDRLLHREAQNQAYRHALSQGVTINMIGKKRWFKNK